MKQVDDERLRLLVLVRLCCAGARAPTEAALRRDLAPLVAPVLPGSAWTTALTDVLDALRRAGEVASDQLVPTAAGRTRVAAVLGRGDLPKWPEVRAKHLPALALALPAKNDAQQQVATLAGLRAAVLRRQQGITTRGTALRPTIDALLWRELGVDTDAAFTLPAVRACLAERMLGTKLRRPTHDGIGAALVARATGVARTDAGSLRAAVIAQWIAPDGLARRSVAPATTPAPVPAPRAELSLADFAARIQGAANVAVDGGFGERKVFISALWRALAAEPAFSTTTLPRFKERLVEANRLGLLRLVRADLVGAMDPDEVSASAATYLNATFHFVERHEGSR